MKAPCAERLRSSAFVRYDDIEVVIDAGPDFRQQMLRAGISAPDAILLTHHHIGGLDDVRAFNYNKDTSYKVCTAFPIFCEQKVQDAMHKVFYYAFAENKYPGVPKYNLVTIENKPFEINGVEIQPIRAFHHKLPVLGFRFGGLAYVTDANMIPEEEFEKLRGLDIFVLNTVRRGYHISHFSLEEAIKVAQRVGAKRTFLTHLSHQLPCYEELAAELDPIVGCITSIFIIYIAVKMALPALSELVEASLPEDVGKENLISSFLAKASTTRTIRRPARAARAISLTPSSW